MVKEAVTAVICILLVACEKRQEISRESEIIVNCPQTGIDVKSYQDVRAENVILKKENLEQKDRIDELEKKQLALRSDLEFQTDKNKNFTCPEYHCPSCDSNSSGDE